MAVQSDNDDIALPSGFLHNGFEGFDIAGKGVGLNARSVVGDEVHAVHGDAARWRRVVDVAVGVGEVDAGGGGVARR